MNNSLVFIYKVIIIGEPATGKTSLVKKYISGRFSQDYRPSLGTNLYIKKIKLDSGEEGKIQLWDIAGQERWIKMRHIYYRGAQGVLLLGDVTRDNSFSQIEEFWFVDVKKYCPDVPLILIGNKIDLESKVSKEKIESIAKRINADTVILTSAKTGDKVEEAFKLISELIFRKLN